MSAKTQHNTLTDLAASPEMKFGIRWRLLLILVAILALLFLVSLAVGSVNIPLEDIIRTLLGGEASKQSWTNIILKFRLPKTLTAMLAGAALGSSGLMMQTFFRNPLAEPYILGISSGASLGVALVVLSTGSVGAVLLAGIGLTGDIMLALAAGMGAGVMMLIMLLAARAIDSSMTLLILGIMFAFFTSAVVSLLMYFSIPERIATYVNWTFGSFGGVTWSQLQIVAPLVLAGLVMAFGLIKSLNALLLGETYARSMGVNVNGMRLWIVAATALLAGTVTAFCGPIGFLGIAVPHLCRGLFHTSDHRAIVPATIVVGAIVAIAAALLAEVPGSSIVLPLNAVTALMGAPVVIWVILRQRNMQRLFAS